MKTIRQVKGVIYQLKQLYGNRASLVVSSTPVNDLQTGRSASETITHVVRKAVLLPENSTLDLSNNLIFAPSTTGPVFKRGIRYVLIDAKDVPVIPAQGNRILIETVTYEIESVETLSGVAHYMKVKVVK